MEESTKRWLLWIIGSAVIACALVFALGRPVHAADLGGTCCSDLEERIADLDATTAHKGNRKVFLQIDGMINEAYNYVSLDGFHDGKISNNGNDRSYVGFTGTANVTKDLSVGYRLEIDLQQLGLLNTNVGNDSKTDVRQSYWFIKSATYGKVSVGRQGVASNDLDEWAVDRAWIAGKPLSVGALSDLYLTGIDLPFDGDYKNAVRYDSPIWEGFMISASWSNSVSDWNGGHGDDYDVAVRYFHDWNQFKVAGYGAYRHSTDFPINLLGITTITIPTGDVNTFLAGGSVLHVPTGAFINASYANQDWTDNNFKLQGIDVTAGLEEKLVAIGKSSVFATWGRISYQPDVGSNTDVDYYGLGAVQSLDAAAMDLYIGWRHYQTGDVLNSNVDSINLGADIKF